MVLHTLPGFWSDSPDHHLILFLAYVDVDDIAESRDPIEGFDLLECFRYQRSNVQDFHASSIGQPGRAF